MGEDVCYLPMLDPEGRLDKSPVILWPMSYELPPPAGLWVMIGAEEPPADLLPLRLPELAGVDRKALESPAQARRVQMLVNAARQRGVVLLPAPTEGPAARAVAEVVGERLVEPRD